MPSPASKKVPCPWHKKIVGYVCPPGEDCTTLIVTSSSARQSFGLEINAVYVVDSVGLAVVDSDVGDPNPTVGVQITSLPPVASRSTTSPRQMVISSVISVTNTSTTTVTSAVPVPHPFESSTVYVVV